ncbi:MAG: hypothetical protein ACK44L_17760, partial [Burkholderiales bacterium]
LYPLFDEEKNFTFSEFLNVECLGLVCAAKPSACSRRACIGQRWVPQGSEEVVIKQLGETESASRKRDRVAV